MSVKTFLATTSHGWNNRWKKGTWHIMEVNRIIQGKNQGVTQGSYG
jgi:hypothetical protein